MAVDYYHRLVVTGPAAGVQDLRKRLHREYERTVRRRTWTEVIPFSFEALSEIAPGVRRILGSEPFDPYDQSVWPVRRIGDARAELRYQLHTRNLEMRGLVRALSRALPRLTFILITFCLDDGDIESYRFRKGSGSKWRLPERRREFHWDRARAKFKRPGDEIFEDDEAERWAEEEMLEETLRHWEPALRAGRPRRREWWDRPVFHDLESEWTIAMAGLGEVLDSQSEPA